MKRSTSEVLKEMATGIDNDDIVILVKQSDTSVSSNLSSSKRLKVDSDVSDSETRLPNVNPFEVDVVLNNLFKYLSVEDLKKARKVCKLWNSVANTFMQRMSVCRFSMPKEFECSEWSPDDQKSKHDQFWHYIRFLNSNKLPFANSSLVFKNFAFINFQYFGPYRHDKTLKLLQKFIPEDVRSLRFEDDPKLKISDDFLEFNQIQWNQRQFQYPIWSTVFPKFTDLQTLELMNMPRAETERCLTALESIIEKNKVSFPIQKLVIWPSDQMEFHLNADAYLSYVDLLKNIVSLLPVREFHLASKCSGAEVKNIIESRRTRIETLILKRFVRTEAPIHALQEKDESLFQNLTYPQLKRLSLPTVYAHRLAHIVTQCPQLIDLKIKFQYPEVCELGPNAQGAQVIHCTRVPIRNNFFSETDLSYAKSCKIQALHWTMDERCLMNAGAYRRQFGQLNSFCTAYFSKLLPRLKSYSGIVCSERDLRIIFQHLEDLEELRILPESLYSTKDCDIIGTAKDEDLPEVLELGQSERKFLNDSLGQKWGIRLMRNLRRLYMENCNNSLTSDTFDYGFLKLQRLQILHIHHAQKLHDENIGIEALISKPSLADVQIYDE